MSSHIHWFRDYSARLNQLAEQADPKELRDTVRLFDRHFQRDPWSATNIQSIMLNHILALMRRVFRLRPSPHRLSSPHEG